MTTTPENPGAVILAHTELGECGNERIYWGWDPEKRVWKGVCSMGSVHTSTTESLFDVEAVRDAPEYKSKTAPASQPQKDSGTVEQPTEIGTFVRDIDGDLWVRVPALVDAVWPWVPWVGIRSGQAVSWQEIKDPVIVHDGYTPPTPEPTHHGARVIDADGLKCVRNSDLPPHGGIGRWSTPNGTAIHWKVLTQPVQVISDGSDW